MKRFFAIILLMNSLAHGEEINPDLPDLLDKVSSICGDRWIVTLDRDVISIYSREEVFGETPGYSFQPGEHSVTLRFKFRIVTSVDARAALRLRRELVQLTQKAATIEQEQQKGHIAYEPRGKDEWKLVIAIRSHETDIPDLPEYKFSSVHLSEEYAMDFFVPNAKDKNAVDCMRDVKLVYELLEKLPPDQTTSGPR